jgi:hypothetical protein
MMGDQARDNQGNQKPEHGCEGQTNSSAVEHVNISVADDWLERFPDVVDALKQAGLTVDQELEVVGIVSGVVDPARLADLARVPGVLAVEPARTIQLPPPESEIQ